MASAGFAAFEALMGAQPIGPEQAYRIVPIRLRPVVAASVGLLALNLVDWALENRGPDGVLGWLSPSAAPSATREQVAEIGPKLGFLYLAMVPVFLGLLWSVGHFAAIYTVGAQAPLRWLRWTSPLALSLAGAATAYVHYAFACLMGGQATTASLVVELLGGALCGWIYRRTVGTARIDPADAGSSPLARSEAFEG